MIIKAKKADRALVPRIIDKKLSKTNLKASDSLIRYCISMSKKYYAYYIMLTIVGFVAIGLFTYHAFNITNSYTPTTIPFIISLYTLEFYMLLNESIAEEFKDRAKEIKKSTGKKKRKHIG